MAEFITLTAQGETYEEAIGEVMAQLISKSGSPDVRVFRGEPDADARPFRDWILDSTDSEISSGRGYVIVTAHFFLMGTDEL